MVIMASMNANPLHGAFDLLCDTTLKIVMLLEAIGAVDLAVQHLLDALAKLLSTAAHIDAKGEAFTPGHPGVPAQELWQAMQLQATMSKQCLWCACPGIGLQSAHKAGGHLQPCLMLHQCHF